MPPSLPPPAHPHVGLLTNASYDAGVSCAIGEDPKVHIGPPSLRLSSCRDCVRHDATRSPCLRHSFSMSPAAVFPLLLRHELLLPKLMDISPRLLVPKTLPDLVNISGAIRNMRGTPQNCFSFKWMGSSSRGTLSLSTHTRPYTCTLIQHRVFPSSVALRLILAAALRPTRCGMLHGVPTTLLLG